MDERPSAKAMDGKLYRTFHCFDREFPVYYQYSDEDGNAIPNYPDFAAAPQYTGAGRPFVLVTQEGCEHALPDTPGEGFGGDCGSCKYFLRESETAYSIFGLCMCEAQRRPQSETEDLG